MAVEKSNQPFREGYGEPDYQDVMTWDDSFAIARALRRLHPAVDLAEISLGLIYSWTMDLPGFADDPALANDSILSAIVIEWIEEAE
jgi:FeS assembly protein IscX